MADLIAARPAGQRGKRVNVTWGDAAGQLRERHDACDFATPAPGEVSAR